MKNENVEKVAKQHYMECIEFYENFGISFSELLEGVYYYMSIGIYSIEDACEATDYDFMG